MNPQGNQSESKTSCLDFHISDKQDSKARLLLLLLLLQSLEARSGYCHRGKELEMKGYTQVKGQSTQGPDK